MCGGCSSVAEQQVVALEVAGSIPVIHPIFSDTFVSNRSSVAGFLLFCYSANL